MAIGDGATERLSRERMFQNSRVTEGIEEESRLKYYAALRDCDSLYARRIRAAATDKDILEFGCSEGRTSLQLAASVRSVCGIDISDEAIAIANRRAAVAGASNARFIVADAMNTGFADASFDLVFGSGIIHHLDTERCMREIHRVLRPGGIAIFKEPLAGNIVLQLYRRATPDMRTPDEHPLVRHDFRIIDRLFGRTDYRHFGLLSIGAVPFRGSRWERPVYRTLAAVDAMLFRFPGLKWQAWYVMIEARKAG